MEDRAQKNNKLRKEIARETTTSTQTHLRGSKHDKISTYRYQDIPASPVSQNASIGHAGAYRTLAQRDGTLRKSKFPQSRAPRQHRGAWVTCGRGIWLAAHCAKRLEWVRVDTLCLSFVGLDTAGKRVPRSWYAWWSSHGVGAIGDRVPRCGSLISCLCRVKMSEWTREA